MQSVFIRHNLSSTDDILKDLWSKHLIAVHYADIWSTKPEDYDKAGKDALRRLWKYCETGAVVGATFSKIKPDRMIVGEIKKGSRVEPTKYDNFVYKTVQLENAREISLRDYPLLSAIQPRQATITGWPSATKYLEAILSNSKLPRKVDSLAPGQLEIICYEYLRMRGILDALVLPIGRALRSIDIYGINQKNENIIAQVTQSRNRLEIEAKMNTLRTYQSYDTKLIFFGPEVCRVSDQIVEYIAVEEIFDKVDAMRPELISKMLGYNV